MDLPASGAAAPAPSSSQIHNSDERTEALITTGAAVGKAPAVSEYERIHRRGSRRGKLKGKEPMVTLTFGPQGTRADNADQEAVLATIIDVAFPHVGGVAGMLRQADAEYRASRDTRERLEQHRARMSFFKGTSDGPHLNPESNPLYNIWESWARSVQFIHSDDIPLGLAKPESTDGQRLRDSAVLEYSYAVPSTQVLQYMVKRAPGGKIVEVGAGSGYWANLLHKLGADVVAVDNGLEVFARSYFPVCKKQDGSEFLAAGGDADGRALFLCWPRMKDDPNTAAATILDNFRGDTIFFVGEEGGTTFCMMEWLEEHKDRGWALEETIPIPTWPGLHDKFMCFAKVAAAE